MTDQITVRGIGSFPGRLLFAGARETRFTVGKRQHKVASWRVSGLDRADRPSSFEKGLGALAGADFKHARSAFRALDGSWAGWGAFYLANTRRIEAEVSGTGWDQAVVSHRSYIEKYPDDFFTSRAIIGLAICLIGARKPKEAKAVVKSRAGKFGMIWELHARLLRAESDRLAGNTVQALSEFRALLKKAQDVPYAREIKHLSACGVADCLREFGDPQKALTGFPIIYTPQVAKADKPDDDPSGDPPKGFPIIYGKEWLASVAGARVLNTVGEILRDIEPGEKGAAAAAPFHLRVNRYHSSDHPEHARALHLASNALEESGLPNGAEWGGEVRGLLKATYPTSKFIG